MRSMSLGDGLLIAPPEARTIEAGSPVRVLLLDGGSVATPPV